MLDWDKLKLFYEVATCGSITMAANKLHVSQPALSRSMMNLEARLQIKLFNRHKRGITLTHQGELLYRGAHKMYIESRNIENNLMEESDEIQGDLKIITTPAIGATWLMQHIETYLNNYPKVRIQIRGQLDEDNMGDCDVLVRPYIQHQPTLVQRRITTFKMCLFASQPYIDKFGMPESAEDLDNHRLITFGGDSMHPLGNINWILNVGRRAGSVRESFLEINSTQGLLRAAQLGLGIVELGKGYPALENAKLVQVLPELKGPEVDIYFSTPEHKKNSKKIQALYDIISNAEDTSSLKPVGSAELSEMVSLG